MATVRLILVYEVDGNAGLAREELVDSVGPAVRRHFGERHSRGWGEASYEARLQRIESSLEEARVPVPSEPPPPVSYDDW